MSRKYIEMEELFMGKVTWEELTGLEPMLLDLYNEAKRHRRNKDSAFCANGVWYGYGRDGGLKKQLSYLVGWDRADGFKGVYNKRI